MRIARFARSGDISYGLVQGGGDDPSQLAIAPLQGHPLFDPTPTGEGNGPVNALDNALRLALCELYPDLAKLELVDYKVRIVSGAHGTDAVTRVLVETSDGVREWDTVGVHENVIAASWQALEEAYTTGLMRQGAGKPVDAGTVGARR